MPTAKTTVTQAEVARYAKAMRAAGVDEFRLEFKNSVGTRVSIVVGKASENATGDDIEAMIARVPDAIP